MQIHTLNRRTRRALAEIIQARACGRLYVDAEHLGYVLRPSEWLARRDTVLPFGAPLPGEDSRRDAVPIGYGVGFGE